MNAMVYRKLKRAGYCSICLKKVKAEEEKVITFYGKSCRLEVICKSCLLEMMETMHNAQVQSDNN